MATLSELRTPLTREQAEAALIADLQGAGLQTTSWQSGSLSLTFLKLFALIYSEATKLIASLASTQFNDLASGEGLTAWSDAQYANERFSAVKTKGKLTLICSAAAGPYTIDNSLDASDIINGFTYRAVDGFGTLSSGGTLVVDIEAETAGAARNVAMGTIINVTSPAMAGVTCVNGEWAGSGTWITTIGRDEESDAALRARNRAKWGATALDLAEDVVEYYAKLAVPSVARIAVDDSQTQAAGVVTVFIAGEESTADEYEASDVQTALNARTHGVPFVVVPATAQPIDFIGDVYLKPGYTSGEVSPKVDAAIGALIASLPIGGTTLPALANKVLRDDIDNAIRDVEGVRHVALTDPSGDVTLSYNEVATVGTISLDYTAT